MNKVKEKLIPWGEWWKKWRWWIFHTTSISLMVTIFVWGIWDAYNCKYLIGEGRPITLKDLLTFLGGAFALYVTVCFFWQAAKSKKEQIKNQIYKDIDDRYNAAVNSLGNSKTSARTGAIYSLYQQAVEHKKYRRQIVQILCSHIRSTTKEQDYQKQYKIKPSDEIQTAIDLLFKKTESTAGLYPQFGQQLPKADLSHAYCAGANFSGAYCKEADFRGAYFQGADFELADCREAGFREASCQETNFRMTRCREANFSGAHCEEADFRLADCQEVDFREAHCWEADFSGASCEEAKFFGAHCERANFYGAYCKIASFRRASCQEADFREAHCWEADFSGAHCQGANFFGTNCQGANFREAHCQGASFGQAHCEGVNFRETRCQGVDFVKANCEGAYGSDKWQPLKNRINKYTELDKVIITKGALPEKFVNAVKQAEYPCSSYWYSEMQKIIEEYKGKEEESTIEDLRSESIIDGTGIIDGKLESDKMESIIKELEDIRKARFSNPQ